MQDLSGRLVVITGGASGIGRALASAFKQKGSRVVLADIDEEGGLEAARELDDAYFFPLDVTDEGAVEEFASSLEEEVGEVDILVNCAGITLLAEVVDTTMEDWHRVIDVNLWGPIHLMHVFLPRMYGRRRGHVVNVASDGGLFPVTGLGAYSATKYALVGLSEILYTEASVYGVKVTVVCPWATWTPIIEKAVVRGYDLQAKEKASAYLRYVCDRPERLARKIVKAVERDKPILVHYPPGKFLDLWHRLSRRSYLAASAVLYKGPGRRLLKKGDAFRADE